MKKLPLLFIALCGFGVLGQSTAMAQREVIVEKVPKRAKTREVYVIENKRPVRRTVFIDERGRYYHVVEGRPVFIERHYDEYPSKYFFRDGRQRPGITISF